MGGFDYFVLFAEMRTGSNFLEANLNAIEGITCHGEAFNPHFIAYPNKTSLLGVTQEARDLAPDDLLAMIRDDVGITGFRYFHDHDPRILDQLLDDPKCAKIILSRNSVESYVSWKIARTTGQWKLTDVARRREAKATFDRDEYETHRAEVFGFQQMVVRRLQVSGQTPFRVSYEDLKSVDVINGIAAFLGCSEKLDKLDQSLKVQNPAALSSKVTNPQEMERALSDGTAYDTDQVPDFEPMRVAAVPSYICAANAPLMFMPIKGGPTMQVMDWMAELDGVTTEDLQTKLSQKDVRQWKRRHKGHRSFTVLRHPVLRAHHVFCDYVLGMGPQVYGAIRQTLIKRYDLDLPAHRPDATYDLDQHKRAFCGFLSFLKGNLQGQTAIRVDAAWCSQAHALQGFGTFASPDYVLRENEMVQDLPDVARRVGIDKAAAAGAAADDRPFALSDIYDDEIENLAAAAYQRDYMLFGFTRWG